MCPILRKTGRLTARNALLCLLLCLSEAKAQSPVLQFSANYVSDPGTVTSYTALPTSPGSFSGCALNLYTYTWNNTTANLLKLVSFTANSKTYVISGAAAVDVKLRRVNNSNVSGQRHILYSEIVSGSASACPTSPRQIDFRAPYNSDMASFLNNNVLNHGTDNLFTNASNSDGNNNNIERVDVVFADGIASAIPADAGFILCERGNNNQHDGFRIAAILSINSSGDPTSFGPVKTCVAGNGSNNGSWGHPNLSSGNRQLAAYVLRKDPLDSRLRVSSNVNQEIGGVFFSLAELGVSPGQTIYGYCLIGPDGITNPTSSQLLDLYNSSVYPTGTTEAQGGGLDLISVNTFFGTNLALSNNGLVEFNGMLHQDVPFLNWEIRDQPNGTRIFLERSSDGTNFSPIYDYFYVVDQPIGQYTDAAITRTYHYRLRIQRPQSTFYSRVIHLQKDEDFLRLYPSLLESNRTLNVEIRNEEPHIFSVTSLSGVTVWRTEFRRAATLRLPATLSPGMYIVAIIRNGVIRCRQKIVLK